MEILRLQKILNYSFKNQNLIKQALTHRSANALNNERLEFLGDSILNFVISTALYQKFIEHTEGELSRLRAHLVKGTTLHKIALEIKLGDALYLGQGELKSGGFRRASILADALEALFGAIFLDSGFEECKDVILSLFNSRLNDPDITENLKDSKTQLQEYLQAKQLMLPKYQLVQVTGVEHDQIFYVSCNIKNLNLSAIGKASNRRKAEQKAASEILKQIMKL